MGGPVPLISYLIEYFCITFTTMTVMAAVFCLIRAVDPVKYTPIGRDEEIMARDLWGTLPIARICR
jgi:hypothetical protein